jgi:hypothetical protein
MLGVSLGAATAFVIAQWTFENNLIFSQLAAIFAIASFLSIIAYSIAHFKLIKKLEQ